MEAIQIIEVLNDKALVKHNKSQIAAHIGVARINYYKMLKTGSIKLEDFLKFVELTDMTPAQFFAELENRTLTDQTSLELAFENEKLKFTIDHLEKRFQLCSEEKIALQNQLRK